MKGDVDIAICNGHLLYWILTWLTPVCETVDSSNSPQTSDYLTNVRYRTQTSKSELFCASSFFDRNRMLRIVEIVELWLVDNWTCYCVFVHGPFSVVPEPRRTTYLASVECTHSSRLCALDRAITRDNGNATAFDLSIRCIRVTILSTHLHFIGY